MYLNHFGLQEKPFKSGPARGFLWLGAKQKEALEALMRGVLEESGFFVVSGGIGTGKTTLADVLLSELGDLAVAAKVTYPDVEAVDFLKLISRAYGLGGGPWSKETFVDQFASFLHSSFSSGRQVVLIIDEAQRMTSEYLAVLFHLSEIRENDTQLLKIVLVGQNRLEDLLTQMQYQEPGQRIAFSHRMEKLTQGESAQYIAHRLNIARCERELIPPSAMEEIFSVSKGVPLLINMVCDLCLSRTFIKGEDTVRLVTVKECAKILRIPEEKAALAIDASVQPQGTEVAAHNVLDKPVMDAIREKITGKPAWVWSAYAAAIFLVISIGFTFLIMPHAPSDLGNTEVKKQATPPAGSKTGRLTEPSVQAGQHSDRSAVMGTKKRGAIGSGRSTEQARQAQIEGLRRDGETPLGNTRRGTLADSGGAANREPMSPGAQDVESGKVIDWLIKKRSE